MTDFQWWIFWLKESFHSITNFNANRALPLALFLFVIAYASTFNWYVLGYIAIVFLPNIAVIGVKFDEMV